MKRVVSLYEGIKMYGVELGQIVKHNGKDEFVIAFCDPKEMPIGSVVGNNNIAITNQVYIPLCKIKDDRFATVYADEYKDIKEYKWVELEEIEVGKGDGNAQNTI